MGIKLFLCKKSMCERNNYPKVYTCWCILEVCGPQCGWDQTFWTETERLPLSLDIHFQQQFLLHELGACLTGRGKKIHLDSLAIEEWPDIEDCLLCQSLVPVIYKCLFNNMIPLWICIFWFQLYDLHIILRVSGVSSTSWYYLHLDDSKWRMAHQQHWYSNFLSTENSPLHFMRSS